MGESAMPNILMNRFLLKSAACCAHVNSTQSAANLEINSEFMAILASLALHLASLTAPSFKSILRNARMKMISRPHFNSRKVAKEIQQTKNPDRKNDEEEMDQSEMFQKFQNSVPFLTETKVKLLNFLYFHQIVQHFSSDLLNC